MKCSLVLSVLLTVSAIFGQTAIHLQTQSKNVDFGAAQSTKPLKTGSVLPASCQVGEMFFRTSSTAGQNVYGCTAANTWVLQSGGGSGGSTPMVSSQFLDFAVVKSADKVLTIGSSCSTATPCQVRFGNTVHTFVTGATATISSGAGSGPVLIFVSNSGSLVIEHASSAGVSISCSGCTSSQVTVPVFPSNSVPLASVAISGGNWDASITDLRALFSSRAITAGPGIQVTDGLGDAVVSIDPADVPRLGANNTFLGENDFSAASQLILRGGTGAPSAAGCSAALVGGVYVRRDAASTQASLYVCANTGAGAYSWELIQGSGGGGGGGGGFSLSTANSGWLDLTGAGGGNFNPSAALTAYYVEVNLPYPVKIAKIAYNVPSGNFGSNYVAWGIYDSSCNLIAGTGGRGDLSTGAHVVTVPGAATIGPGVFYLGFGFDSTAPIISTTNRLLAGLLQSMNPPRLFRGATAPTGTGATLTMPSSCGTKTGESFVVPTFYVVE